MAYLNQSDLVEKISEATLIQLTDTTASGQIDSALVDSAIADAGALVDSMISPVYKVPLETVPRVIVGHAATIAIYKLHLFRSVDPGVWKDEYVRTLAFLQSVVEGKATLEGALPEPAPADDLSKNLYFESQERKFSRSKLKDW